MPTFLDVLLLVVMLISGLLAMIRGFMREILSIGAWIVAALVTLYSYSRVLPVAQSYVSSSLVAKGITIAGVFLLTLMIVSILTVRISDMVLDSRVGALDRTLGFLFGLMRGLFVVVVAYIFFTWLVPPHSRPGWVKEAKSAVVLQSTGDWLKSMLPDNLDKTISNIRQRSRGEQEPSNNSPDPNNDLPAPSGTR